MSAWAKFTDPSDGKQVAISTHLNLVVVELDTEPESTCRILPCSATEEDAGVAVAGTLAAVCAELDRAARSPEGQEVVQCFRDLIKEMQTLRMAVAGLERNT